MTEKILLIDDDPMILSSYQRTLRQFSIDTASGGPEALAKIAMGESYAVVLSDLRMPGMDGLALLRRTHENAPDSIGIILTGNADLRTAIEAINEGNVFRYLEKPYPYESLAKVLLAALEQFRRVISEKNILKRTPHHSSKVHTGEASSRRASFNTGDEVLVVVDGSRQQRGVIDNVLPTFEENDPYKVCLIRFPDKGNSKGHYFAKELRPIAPALNNPIQS
jgi:DNA-binding NtrC family response regulator